MFRRITALMLTLCLAIPAVLALAEDTFSVRYDVTFDQTEARTMVAMLNDFRTGSDAWYWNADDTEKIWCEDLAPLTYDPRLEAVAMQRAAELAVFYAHMRPDGSMCYTAYTDDISWWAAGENIAIGYYSIDEASEVFTAWQETNDPYAKQGHRRNMLSSDFNSVGFGYASIGQYHFWAQEFARLDDPAADPGTPFDGTSAVTVPVREDLVTGLTDLMPAGGTLTVNWSETAAAPTVSGQLTMTQSWPSGRTTTVVITPAWTSADPLCAEVGADGVTGRALGSTSLSASLLENTFTMPVTVRYPGRLDPDLILPDHLTSLGSRALNDVAAAAVSVPAGLQTLGSRVFAGSSIRQVTFAGDAFTPASDAFDGCPQGLVVFCPDGAAADLLAGFSGITLVRVR